MNRPRDNGASEGSIRTDAAPAPAQTPRAARWASSAAGLLAGCENTTEPIGASGGRPRAPPRSSSSRSRSARAACRCRGPDNAVTWAITDDNPPIEDGRPAEGGPLNIYNYADYLDPATLKRFQKQYGV